MDSLNSLVKNEIFRTTELYEEFKNRPLGFVDVGARGGVHPFILPIASLVNCLCFEPNEGEEKIVEINKHIGFSSLIVYNTALSNEVFENRSFYITKEEESSSLFKPDEDFIKRYGKSKFSIKKEIHVKTQLLDNVAENVSRIYSPVGEVIKLDCQGAEYLILQGAQKVLESQCMVVWCEVFFIRAYENQRLFSDIDQFLRQKGFVLYGLYPRYVSAKKMDRKAFETEERVQEADALYIKDPLDPITKNLQFSGRSIKVLILVACCLGYFDFICELIQTFIKNDIEKVRLVKWVKHMALLRKKKIEKEIETLISRCLRVPERKYLYAKKFIDENKGNNDISFIQLD